MSEEQKRVLEQQLWNIANTLRGKMNADEFRDYILGFIFYKYLSEKMEIFANDILKQDKIKFREINSKMAEAKEFIEAIKEEALEKLGYFLKPEELFTEVAKRGNGDNTEEDLFDESKTNFILEDLQKILINIQLSTMGTDSEEDFDNLFEDMDLNSTKLGKTPEARNVIIAKVLAHLDKIDFKLESTELDVLGDAYEYLIAQFASGAGKKAGEFYTPQGVSKILAKIVTTGKQKLKSVYDPTCGSGSLLLRVAKEVKEVNNFYGQEMNRTTYNLARMNMILHGVHYRKFDIKQEDTLERPQHIEMQFEAVVANPPFSAKWSANPLFTSDDRFSQYGKLAPSSKADFAFVQHMIYHLAENGTMAIVLPHGALFRGGAEQHIRAYLIENKNFLDAVIGLPSNIFYGTSIPTAIMVYKKCRESSEDILFIDASNEFEKVKTQNILTEEHINKILETYRQRKELEKYSKRISLKEVIENNCNLNITKYLDTYEVKKDIDIKKLCSILNDIQKVTLDNDVKLKSVCNRLGVPFPDGYNLSLLKLYKQGILQKLLSQELRFKDENGKDFPKWDMKKLGAVTFKTGNKNKKSKKYPIYSINNKEGFLPQSEQFEGMDSNDRGYDISMYKIITKNTFAYNPARINVGSIGYSGELNNVIISSLYVCFKTTDEINDEYLMVYLKSNDFNKAVLRSVEGGVRSYLFYDNFSSIDLPVPFYKEQVEIANFINLIDNKIANIEIEMSNNLK
ncbi:type I restriction-modification system, DNA-methyltransferase subunit M [Aquipluma nitroreducens]|uniref:site-specific DNA-methyltransferase (adenine-specific) n=1 Tax=Aquipluma nitroreducens TaxID=2010828 RepID=A0A5K7SGW1_9BACT|nr:type I restriction-modification system subunit M [Aquipluma nitroreducens]BBE20667.1 type I restriction-modification system, DNA-methyltransferase subunit M [Aquipluma nitroreducens]